MAITEKIPASGLIEKLPGGVFLTTTENIFKWAKVSSLWPLIFGLACCAIEMIAAGASRFDIDRFGSGVFRASPRQCDVLILAGTVSVKMGNCIKRLYAQMPEPKYFIAMGNCAITGGIFCYDTYSVMKGTEELGKTGSDLFFLFINNSDLVFPKADNL